MTRTPASDQGARLAQGDPATPPAHAHAVATAIPGAHLANIEQPERVTGCCWTTSARPPPDREPPWTTSAAATRA